MVYKLRGCTESGRVIGGIYYEMDLDECLIESYISMFDFHLISISGPSIIYDNSLVGSAKESTNVIMTPAEFKNMVINVAKENDESLYLKIKLLNLDTWGV